MADISAQLQEQVRAARRDRQPLCIQGGGSKVFMGREPVGEALSVAGHRGIVSYEPVELVLTARAGTPLSEIEAALEEQGQMLAFEPPRYGGGATLGGTLACNQSGPARPWWGSIRDHVLGIRLINGWGQQLRFGGQVMKNVAGYDVSRLMAGAMGTLGVITEVSLKVLPKPASQLTLVEPMGLAEAIRLMNQRAGQPKPLSAACWWDGKLYSRLSGARSAVEATAEQWGGEPMSENDDFWLQLREQQLAFFSGDTPLWRFSVNGSAEHPALAGDWLLDWGGAQRWLRAPGELEALEAHAARMGGCVSCHRGGDRQRERFHAPSLPVRQLQTRLKQSFDPDRLFNPGRLYSWL